MSNNDEGITLMKTSDKCKSCRKPLEGSHFNLCEKCKKAEPPKATTENQEN